MTRVEGPVVRVGQVWEDCDYRSRGRLVKVIRITQTHAVVTSPSGLGRETRISLDRMRPIRNGYRLVRDVEGGAQ